MNTQNIRDLLQTDASTTAIKVSRPSMTPGHSVNTLSPTDLLAGSYSSFILPAASTSAGMMPPPNTVSLPSTSNPTQSSVPSTSVPDPPPTNITSSDQSSTSNSQLQLAKTCLTVTNGIPQFHLPGLLTKASDHVAINIDILDKFYPKFSFVSMMKYLAKLQLPSSVPAICNGVSSIKLLTDSPSLLEYHLQLFFFSYMVYDS